MTADYRNIAAHYEACFKTHGDSHKGVDWPNAEDARLRYQVMLECIRPDDLEQGVRLLDVGCGAGHLLDHIESQGLTGIEYVGLDISDVFVEHCRAKYPDQTFVCADLLTNDPGVGAVDYAVMNGVFTEKVDMSFDDMFAFFKKLVTRVYGLVERGVAFNVMSKQVDWERDDLFHLPLDLMADFVCRELGRDFVVRNDYGLYEYTVYLYKRRKEGNPGEAL